MALRSDIALPEREQPLLLAWPAPGDSDGFLRLEKPAEWQAFIGALGIDPRIPETVRVKFARAQLLYLMGWIDLSLLKAGELAELIALELALTDRYGAAVPKRNRTFSAPLKHMVNTAGLADGDIPMVQQCGGTVIGQLTGETAPTLAVRRNMLAHGIPFDGLPTGGLLELVRDLIDHAYRNHVLEVGPIGAPREDG